MAAPRLLFSYANVALRPSMRDHKSVAQTDTRAPRVRSQLPRLREEQLFILLSAAIGVVVGVAVVLFRLAIDWCHTRLLGTGPGALRMLLAPSLAGLLVGVLVLHVFPGTRGSGVNQTKAALYIYDGYIPFRTAIGKFITSALAIGAGHSLGPEDPSLQIGACIASAIGRRLRLSRERVRLIAPIGATAGLAAAFNAPISAVLFVIEEVIGRWSAGILGAIVLSSVSSVVVMRGLLGSEPVFGIPPVQALRTSQLIAYSILGVVGGLASVAFSGGIGLLRPVCKGMPRWTQNFQPAVAGLLIGIIGVMGAPQVMGAGYDVIDAAMRGKFTWELLGILAGLKIVATLLSFVSGTPGGMFAPTLFIGAMLGAAVGDVEHALLPQLAQSPGTYALVSMGVLFAGFLRAPMTSVFMVLEVSGNYSIIVAVILANTLSYVISRALQPTPIFDLLTRQDGLELPSMEEQREEKVLRVEDAMRPPTGPVLEADQTPEEAWRRWCGSLPADGPNAGGSRPPGEKREIHADDLLLIRWRPSGWSSLSGQQLAAMIAQSGAAQSREAGADACDPSSPSTGSATLRTLLHGQRVPRLHPDQPLHTALRYLDRWPLLPVVHRAEPGKLEGVLSREDVLQCYARAESE